MDAPLPNGSNGRDALGRFTAGNTASKGRAHPFARRCAAIRTAFLEAVSPQDIQAIVRMLVCKAKGGDLVASELIFLWALGRPDDAYNPDAVEAMVAAAETQAETRSTADQVSPSLPAARAARRDQAARELAEEIRATRGAIPDPGDVVEQALEDFNRPF